MLTKAWASLDGYKTYSLSGLGILVALAGHFWGPFNVGPLAVPVFSWEDVWKIAWNGGLFSALRAAKS